MTYEEIVEESKRIRGQWSVPDEVREKAAKELEVGQWPGDEDTAKTIKTAPKEDFEKTVTERQGRMADVTKARQTEQALKDEDSLLGKVKSAFTSKPTEPPSAPVPLAVEPAQTPSPITLTPSPIRAPQQRASPPPVPAPPQMAHTLKPGKLPPPSPQDVPEARLLASAMNRDDRMAVADSLDRVIRKRSDLPTLENDLRQVYGKYLQGEQLEKAVTGTMTVAKKAQLHRAKPDELSPIATLAEQYKQKFPQEAAPKVGPDKPVSAPVPGLPEYARAPMPEPAVNYDLPEDALTAESPSDAVADPEHRQLVSKVADLFASYMDQPNDPNAKGSLQDEDFYRKFNEILPPDKHGYTPEDFGVLQQNPQYRGLRLVAPQSGGSYGEIVASAGMHSNSKARIYNEGPPNRPDPLDPHKNQIMRYPENMPSDGNALREEVYGELIRRGYPVLGGTGEMGGDFQPGFNPIGFGQRDESVAPSNSSQPEVAGETPDWLRPAEPPPSIPNVPLQFTDKAGAPLREQAQPMGNTIGQNLTEITNNYMQGVGEIPASALRAVAEASATLDKFLPEAMKNPATVEERMAYKMGETVTRLAKEAFPTDPARQKEFLVAVLPRALGSMTGFLIGGVAGAVAEAPVATTMVLGALAGGDEGYQDAKKSGADEGTKEKAFWMNAGVGTSEAVPIGHMLGRFNQATGGRFLHALKTGGIAAAEEFLQEFFQTTAGNVIAKDILEYDKQRNRLEGAGEAGEAGGAAGWIMGLITGAIGGKRAKAQHEQAETPAQPVERPAVQQRPQPVEREAPVPQVLRGRPAERQATEAAALVPETLETRKGQPYRIPQERPQAVESPVPVERPAAVEAPVPVERPKPETRPAVIETKASETETKGSVTENPRPFHLLHEEEQIQRVREENTTEPVQLPDGRYGYPESAPESRSEVAPAAESAPVPVEAEAPKTQTFELNFQEGERVTYESKGKPVTGTIVGFDNDELTVQVDQIAKPGGVPIKRKEYVKITNPTLQRLDAPRLIEDSAPVPLDTAAHEAATSQEPTESGAPLKNGWFAAPQKGRKYRATYVQSTNSVMLEKRNEAGGSSAFYVGKDGELIDADEFALNDSAARERLWNPPPGGAGGRAISILHEMGKLDVYDPKRKALKQQLKDLVTGSGGGGQSQSAPVPLEAAAHEAATSPQNALPEPSEAQANPTPDRSRNVFLGKAGNRKITFDDPLHAELFDFSSALKKSIAGDKSIDIQHRIDRLKAKLNLPSDANVGAIAQEYRRQILDQAKAGKPGEAIKAPAPTKKEDTSLTKAEAPAALPADLKPHKPVKTARPDRALDIDMAEQEQRAFNENDWVQWTDKAGAVRAGQVRTVIEGGNVEVRPAHGGPIQGIHPSKLKKLEKRPEAAPAPIAVPSPNFSDVRASAVDAEKAFNAATTLEEKRKHLDRVSKLKQDYLDAARLNSDDYASRRKFFDDILSKMNRVDLEPLPENPLPPAAKPAELPTEAAEKPGRFAHIDGAHNEAALELRSKAHDKERPGDVLLDNGRFVSLDDAIRITQEGIEAGEVRPVPFQLYDRLGIAIRDAKRVIDGATKADVPLPSKEPAAAKLPDNVPDSDQQAYSHAGDRIAHWVANRLESGSTITAADLFKISDQEFGGTTAEGKYTPKDAYDALELGVNRYIIKNFAADPGVTTVAAALDQAKQLRALLDKLPTQTRRTEEQVEFQQFSTPPDLAFVMAWASDVHLRDTALEPSAGLGGLAIFAHEAGAKVVMNEYNDRRAALLKTLNIGKVYTENAEQLDNILPESVKPTVVIMNPPFSSTAGRIPGQRKTTNGIMHLEQALARLEPGGRLVALIGKGKMHADPKVLEDWLSNTAKSNAYRARIGLSGNGYKKYGTEYSNQIIIFDKIKPDGVTPLIANFDDVLDAVPLLKEVRDVRQSAQSGTAPTKQPAAQPDRAPVSATREDRPGSDATVSAPASGVGAEQSEAQDTKPGLARPISAGPRKPAGQRAGSRDVVPDNKPGRPGEPVSDAAATAKSDEPARSGARDSERPGPEAGSGSERGRLPTKQVPQKLELEQTAKKSRKSPDLSESVYEDYTPAKFKVKGAKAHPGKLAESSALAAVEPVDVHYTPHLPQSVIERGELSMAQLEAVAYAGQAHSQLLPDGSRKGFFLGDGPGVGKGRTIAGMIMDNWNQGKKKAVWLSETQNLYNSAIRDWTALGGKETDLYVINKTKLGAELPMKQGLMFMTYSTMGSGIEVTRDGQMKAKQVKGGKPEDRVKTRFDQIAQWLGKDFDGIIVFDEAHNMQNAMGEEGDMGATAPAARALAGVELQKKFPNARIVYSSATGATKIEALAYAERLGLWGPGTSFPQKEAFLTEIGGAGLGTMEIVAQNLKAQGTYISRNLSYDGVTYDKIEHKLTKDQQDIYDEMGRAWQVVLKNINAAMQLTGVTGTTNSGNVKTKNGRAKMAVMGKLWGTQLRFYNQVMNALQMPSVLEDMKQKLEAGESVVVQLTNTDEAALGRALDKAGRSEDADLGSIDLTPREDLINYVRASFPVGQFEDYMDDNGNIRSRPVMDSQGNQVENREAVRMREQLIENLQSIRVPESPIDQILNTFGPKNVAEITGREERVLRYTNENGEYVEEHEQRRSDALRRSEVQEFMNDKRQILIFSEKGGTGESYHADLTKKNQRMRNHYLVQAGWRADKAVQGLGRTHRTNQKQPPRYVLCMTNLKGHKRFISTIARRLDQLGALTKGQRQAGSSGFIDAKDNLENRYATRAINQLVHDVFAQQVPDVSMQTLTEKLGLGNLIDPRDGRLQDGNIPDVPRFMNRLLSLELGEQNVLFEEFMKRMNQFIEIAANKGELDTGMETVRASGGIRELSNEVAYTDPTSGAKTNLVHLEATHATQFTPADEVEKNSLFTDYYTNKNTGKVSGAIDNGNRTQDDGSIVHVFRLQTPVHGKYSYVSEEALTNKYTKLEKKDGRAKWQEQIKAEKPSYTEKFYMVTGSVLNIWNRLPKLFPKIIRLQTEEGNVHLGIQLGETHVNALKGNLGLDVEKAPDLSPAEYATEITEKGAVLQLANQWTIKRAKVAGENRIEIVGNNLYRHKEELLGWGAFNENIQSAIRYFVPTGSKAGAVLEKILKSNPVVKFIGAAKKAVGDERGSIPLGSLVPALTKKPGDVVVGATGPVAFADPASEKRFQLAKQGVKPETFVQRVKDGINEIRKQTREFPELPDVPEYSQLRTSLLTLQKMKGIAADRTIRQLKSIIGDFGPNKMDVFTRKVLLDDLVREAEEGRSLPFGLTKDSVEQERDKVDALLAQNPDIADAVDQRKTAWRGVKSRYQVAMRSIGLDKLADRLSKEDYFRHQVLEYANERRQHPAGAGKELKSPTGRGFNRQRHGSEKDINANYLQADFEVMAQMEHDIAVAKTIRLVDKEHNIASDLKKAAKQANTLEVEKRIAGNLQLEEKWADFKKRIGMGMSKVREALGLNKQAILSFDQLKEYAEQEGHPAQGGALMAFKAMSERRQWIKEFLGKDFQTWEDRIPEGYQVWQPEPGNVFFMAETIPHRLARQLTEALVPSLNISAEQLRAVMAMGSPKEQYVIPDEVYHTLKAMAQPIPPIWQRTIRQVQGHWKQVMLLAPRRFLRYNLRNLTGDADAVFAGNPSAMKTLPKAMHDLWPVFFGKEAPLTGEVKEWFDRGGFQTTLQVQEMGDLNELKLFRDSLEREQKGGLLSIPARIFNGYWKNARLATDYREAMLRYANYLNYLEQMRGNANQRPNNFGASIRENVMALPDLRDRAFKLSNELLGAYDRVSAIGQNLRNYWYPFFSWVEVNFRRYKQMIKNAFKDIGSAKLARLGGVATLKAAKWLVRFSALWAALQAWNMLMFPGDDDELDEATRNRPHILFGRSDDGKIRYLSGIGAMGDLLSWFGLDVAPAVTRDVLNGKMTVPEALKQMAKAPVNKLVQGVTPLVKTPAELIARESTYPDIFHPRPIQDRGEYLAQQLTLSKEYGKLKGKPQQPDDFAGLVIQRQDPGSAAYTDWSGIESRFLEKIGKERGIHFRSPRSEALRNVSRAIQQKDASAEAYWREKYVELGGTKKGMEASVRALAPLYGMSRVERDQLLATLDAADRKILKRAETYYKEKLTQVLPDWERSKLLRKLASKGWLSKEEADVPSFLNPEVPASDSSLGLAAD